MMLKMCKYTFLNYYLEMYQILEFQQSECQTGHSSQTALLVVTENACELMNSDILALLVLFAFRKVFDTKDYKRLQKIPKKLPTLLYILQIFR